MTATTLTAGVTHPVPGGESPNAASEVAPRRREHLYSIDLVRVLTIVMVIAVHTITIATSSFTTSVGGLTMVFHASREVFFILTAFVLAYGYGHGPVRWRSFWRKRYLCVTLPYVAWTIVYFAGDGNHFLPLPSAVRTIEHYLVTGTAEYHLYFLLVSMQIYMVFPLVRWLLHATCHHHGKLLAVCAAFQVVFSLAVQQQWVTNGVLGRWLANPDALLPSYPFYILLGAVAAWHVDQLITWTRCHVRLVLVAAAASIVIGLGSYFAQVYVGRQPAYLASAVFQPVMVIESLGIAWALLVAGISWVDHGKPARRLVMACSDASFGIYLAHPLILQGLLVAASASGLLAASSHLPVGAVLAVLVILAVPFIYLCSGVGTVLVRRSPLSLALTGRPQVGERWSERWRPRRSHRSSPDVATDGPPESRSGIPWRTPAEPSPSLMGERAVRTTTPRSKR
ncbi:MAG: hypothetical protein DLM54_12410 [Acidimicrobiales bacterium]|nr:MAG: hypothetical protein DLM54_12410 [Acidimicrobiales bacterium]